jgi:hypothetical protein
MSIDSQRLEIEYIRRKIALWQTQQPDSNLLLQQTTRYWLQPALDTLNMNGQTLVTALKSKSGGEALYTLLTEQTFGLIVNEDSLFDRFVCGPAGRSEQGLCYRYLRRLANSVPSMWRVIDIESGVRLHVAPWGGGETVIVHDRKYAKSVGVGDLLVTRLIDMPAGPMFGDAIINFRNVARDAVLDSREGLSYLLSHSVTELFESTVKQETPSPAIQPDEPNKPRSSGAGEPPPNPGTKQPPAGSDRERLLDRVRKLFAMAQQAEASPHEAEIALRRCESLMRKYGITEADLETSAFGSAEFTAGRTVPMHVKFLAAAVATLHDVLFVSGRNGFAEFRGFEVDTNVARLTLDYLLNAVERALTARKRAGNFPAGRSAAYDYRVGFASEVNKRVTELVAQRNRVQQQAAGTGTALTVRKREIVERECGRDLATSTFRGRGVRDSTARAAGTDDGARVSLDQQVESAPERSALPEC